MSSKNQLLYEKWYRQFGVRNFTHLRNPRIFNYDTFVLPKQVIYHWVDYRNLFELAPSIEEPVLKRSGNKLFTKFIKEYSKPENGKFIRLSTPLDSLILGYYNEHSQHLKPTREIYQYNEVGYISMVSYGLFDKIYKYPKTRTSYLEQWKNYHRTVFDTAREIAIKSGKQQFIELNVPRRFPTKPNIDKCQEGINGNNISFVNHPDMWLVIEFWNLLSEGNYSHLFQNYTLEDFKYINILWRMDNKFCCMNLGVLLDFLKVSNISHLALQRYFLKLMINLSAVKEVRPIEEDSINDNIEINTVTEEEPIVTGIIEDENNDETDDNQIFNIIRTEKKEDISNVNNTITPTEELSNKLSVTDDEIFADIENNEEETDTKINEEIENALELVAEDTSGVDTVYKPYIQKENDAKTVIDEETSKLVKAGIMSTGSRERLLKLTEESYQLDSPFDDSKNIKENMIIQQEDVIINDENPLPIKSLDIIDESMTQSTINKITDKYIRHVLDKDILRMVMNLQKGGLVIKDYKTEEIEDIHNHFIIHRIQIETLKGHVSTLTFKTPKVYPDGTFISNNSKRRLRTQRRDKKINLY